MAASSQRPLIGVIIVIVIVVLVLMYRASVSGAAPPPAPPALCAGMSVAVGDDIACGNGGPFPNSTYARYSYQPDTTLDPMMTPGTGCNVATECSASKNSLGYWACRPANSDGIGNCYPAKSIVATFADQTAPLDAAAKYTTNVSEAACISACVNGAVPGCKAYIYRDPGSPDASGAYKGDCSYYAEAPVSLAAGEAYDFPNYVGILA